MDQTLKQRLIGASVLIALAVIFIPMIFEAPNDSNTKSISIEIPEEPEGLQQKTFSLNDNKGMLQESNEKPIETVVSHQEKVISVIDNSNIEKQPEIDAKIDSKVDAQDDLATTENVSSNESNLVSNKTETDKIDEPKVVQEDNQVTNKDDFENKNFSYRVKLGSFTLEKNAQKLKSQLINHGLVAMMSENLDSKLFDVYSNPFSNKELAQAYSKKIQSLNLKIGKPRLINLNEEETRLLEMNLSNGFVIQLGSFSSKENSLKLRDKLRNKGFVTFVDKVLKNKNVSYRVRVGPFVSEKDAEANKIKIKRVMKIDGLIKSHELTQVIN